MCQSISSRSLCGTGRALIANGLLRLLRNLLGIRNGMPDHVNIVRGKPQSSHKYSSRTPRCRVLTLGMASGKPSRNMAPPLKTEGPLPPKLLRIRYASPDHGEPGVVVGLKLLDG